MATILFANSSSSLSSRDRSILASVRQLQKERGGKFVLLATHQVEHEIRILNHKMINLKVSTARAQAVAENWSALVLRDTFTNRCSI